MQVVPVLLILLFCSSAEFRRAKNGGLKSRLNMAMPRALRRSTVKRFAAAECKEYFELNEKYLDCQDRKLTQVSAHWPEDTLHMLLARNRIRRLEDDMFARFKHLKSLDLQQNDIAVIEERAFAGLNKLTTLLLQHNRLQVVTEEVFIFLPQLKYMRIYENPWDCSCELDSLVRKLQVPSNRNLGNYAKCVWPKNLKDQKLKKIKPELLCPELEVMEPNQPQNQVLGTAFVIKEVDSTTCHTYMFPTILLDCHNKDLKKVPADIPPDAVKIDLSGNKIKHLKSKEFVGLKHLKTLNLSSNALEYIDTVAFSGLLQLRELDLSNNSLHYIEYGVLEDLYSVQKLWVGNNPWRCDYNIHYLDYWLKHHRSVEHTGLICKTPEEFKDWSVYNYVKSYNEECPKDKLISQTDTIQEGNADAEEVEEGQINQPQHLIRPKKQDMYTFIRLT
ncbi:leucine-rich repeat-containing protein 17-like isoform X1 [Polyodon spathula]|nr:leucine-rich repeat-containing protein 17-like isoform X1 [Polyodon spathula]